MCPRLPDNMDRGPSTSLLRVGSQLKFYADFDRLSSLIGADEISDDERRLAVHHFDRGGRH
jgi:hypothetical protein